MTFEGTASRPGADRRATVRWRVNPADNFARVWQLTGYAAMGAALLLSTALPERHRGALAVHMTASIMGSAMGGLSLDTVIPALPNSPSRSQFARLAGVGTAATALLAGGLAATMGTGSTVTAMCGALCCYLLTLCIALVLRPETILLVQRSRALGSIGFLCAAGFLVATGPRSWKLWLALWLCSQLLSAALLAPAAKSAFRSLRPDAVHDSRTVVKLLGFVHVGVLGQALVYRLDQVMLARYQPLAQLGVYSLAASGIDAATGPAQIEAQRLLTSPVVNAREAKRAGRLAAGLALAVGLAVTAFMALLPAALGRYHEVWLLTLALLPGSIALAVQKPLAAGLVRTGASHVPTVIAGATGATALMCYFLAAVLGSAVTVAATSSILYLGSAATHAWCLSRHLRRDR